MVNMNGGYILLDFGLLEIENNQGSTELKCDEEILSMALRGKPIYAKLKVKCVRLSGTTYYDLITDLFFIKITNQNIGYDFELSGLFKMLNQPQTIIDTQNYHCNVHYYKGKIYLEVEEN